MVAQEIVMEDDDRDEGRIETNFIGLDLVLGLAVVNTAKIPSTKSRFF
jgi:hypothetical protein